MKNLSKKSISLVLIFTLLLAIFMPCIVNAKSTGAGQKTAKDVYIDNTVDNSKSYVIAVLNVDNEQIEVYNESANVSYSNPKTSEVETMIEEAYQKLIDEAKKYNANFEDSSITTSTSTGKVWDNRKYETIEDGDAILIGDSDYLTGAYGVNSDYTRTHIASGDYGKITYFRVEANVLVSNAETPSKVVDQIQIWSTSGGKVSVKYNPSEPNSNNLKSKEGTSFTTGEIVAFYKRDEITVIAKADEGYKFKGWYHVDIDWKEGSSEHPVPYQGEAFNTNTSYTYKPSETVLTGDAETLRYVCAVFEKEETTVSYEVIEGSNQTYTINEDETATFRINADYSLFENGGKVYVDDELVSSDNYTSKSGSTIITFINDFMNNLSEGEHTLKVAFNNNGTATTKFTVSKSSTTTEETTTNENTNATTETATKNPQTGDNITTTISIFLLSTLGILIMIKLNKKM